MLVRLLLKFVLRLHEGYLNRDVDVTRRVFLHLFWWDSLHELFLSLNSIVSNALPYPPNIVYWWQRYLS